MQLYFNWHVRPLCVADVTHSKMIEDASKSLETTERILRKQAFDDCLSYAKGNFEPVSANRGTIINKTKQKQKHKNKNRTTTKFKWLNGSCTNSLISS